MAKKETNYSSIIDQLTANTKELLEANYSQAYSLRDEENVTKISIVHLIQPNEFGEIETESTIAFGQRIKERVAHTVDMTGQLDFDKPTKSTSS